MEVYQIKKYFPIFKIMIFETKYRNVFRDRNSEWFLRQMCKEIKDYTLSLSFDANYTNTLYHVNGVQNGETSEILAQEFPFLNVYCIDDWKLYPELEREFEDRTKFYPNLFKMYGKAEDFADTIASPIMVYIDNCKGDDCILDDLMFWLPRMNNGSIISGHHLSYKQYDKPKKLHNAKKAIIRGINEHPQRVYLDGSWLYKL